VNVSSTIPIILGSVLCAVVGQLMLKSAMNRVGRVGRSSGAGAWRAGLPRLIIGFAVYGVSTLLWLLALSRVPLSFAFPFISLSYVAIVLAAKFLFHEQLDRNRLAGSALIVIGVLLVSLTA